MSQIISRGALVSTSLLALLVACGDRGTSAPEPVAPRAPAAPQALRLAVSPDTVVLDLGGSAMFTATKVMSDSSRVRVAAAWAGGAGNVMGHPSGTVVALAPGASTIVAYADGVSGTATIVVRPPRAVGASDALRVESFSILEYQVPGQSNLWYYVPQVRVAGVTGSATVLSLSFVVPGLSDPIPIFACGASLSAGMSIELNGGVNNDYAWVISQNGRRASGADATATLTYLDGTGTMATTTLRGPVTTGTFVGTPWVDEGACLHG